MLYHPFAPRHPAVTSHLENTAHPLLPTHSEQPVMGRSLAELVRQREIILSQMRALDAEIRRLENHAWLLN